MRPSSRHLELPYQENKAEACAAILRLVISGVNARNSGPDVTDRWGVEDDGHREHIDA